MDTAEENNNSVGLRGEHGKSALLLTGDSQWPERAFRAENRQALVRDSDVLKPARHGSSDGVDESWLEPVHPRLAVILCGAGNSYGRSSRQVLDLLEERAIRFKWTDLDGTVRVVSEGRGWKFDPGVGSGAVTTEDVAESIIALNRADWPRRPDSESIGDVFPRSGAVLEKPGA